MKKLVLLSLVFGLTACGDLPVPTEGIMTPPSVEKALKDTINKANEGVSDMAEGAMDMANDAIEATTGATETMVDGAMDMADNAVDVITEIAPEPVMPENMPEPAVK